MNFESLMINLCHFVVAFIACSNTLPYLMLFFSLFWCMSFWKIQWRNSVVWFSWGIQWRNLAEGFYLIYSPSFRRPSFRRVIHNWVSWGSHQSELVKGFSRRIRLRNSVEEFSGGILLRDLIKSEEYSRRIQLRDPVEEFSRRI